MKKKTVYFSLLIIIFFALVTVLFIYLDIDLIGKKRLTSDLEIIKKNWMRISGNVQAKVVYSDPPSMYVLYLNTGERKKIHNVKTEGGPGRFNRGKTPRPFWNNRGDLIVYRYSNSIFITNEKGDIKKISNGIMDVSKETRWSFSYYRGKEYIFGPSVKGNGILIDPQKPSKSIEIFKGGKIDKHCEMTGDGKHIVYDNGRNIFLSEPMSEEPGIKISKGQSCRPCASPSKFVAWLPAPHTKYFLYFSKNGNFAGSLRAPKKEEIYRLNWSNVEQYAVHMYGSRGNTKMNVRDVFSGESIFIGYGWDPDLWVNKD